MAQSEERVSEYQSPIIDESSTSIPIDCTRVRLTLGGASHARLTIFAYLDQNAGFTAEEFDRVASPKAVTGGLPASLIARATSMPDHLAATLEVLYGMPSPQTTIVGVTKPTPTPEFIFQKERSEFALARGRDYEP